MNTQTSSSRGWRWIAHVGWQGRCPRCGTGALFDGWLKIRQRCGHCDLDHGYARPDDGPAFFALAITAFPLIFLVVWVQVAFGPPWWVHVLTTGPVMAFGTLGSLRPFKGWLVAAQFVHRAQEAGTEALARKLEEAAAGKET